MSFTLPPPFWAGVASEERVPIGVVIGTALMQVLRNMIVLVDWIPPYRIRNHRGGYSCRGGGRRIAQEGGCPTAIVQSIGRKALAVSLPCAILACLCIALELP